MISRTSWDRYGDVIDALVGPGVRQRSMATFAFLLVTLSLAPACTRGGFGPTDARPASDGPGDARATEAGDGPVDGWLNDSKSYVAHDQPCEVGRDACLQAPGGGCYRAEGSCDPQLLRCVYQPLEADAPCDDGDACTAERCDGRGTCVSSALACDRPPNACYRSAGSCGPQGTCVYPALGAGSPCDDGDPDTADDACSATMNCQGVLDKGWPLLLNATQGGVGLNGLGVDAKGNVYLAATFGGTWLSGGGFAADITVGAARFDTAGAINTYLGSATRGGDLRWGTIYTIAGAQVDIREMQVTGDGRSYAAGFIKGTLDLGGGTVLSQAGSQGPVVLVHDSAGAVQQPGHFAHTGANNGQLQGIGVSSGYAVIAGAFAGNIDLGGGVTISAASDRGLMALVDSSMAGRWGYVFPRPVGPLANPRVAVDASGTSWITGHFGADVDYGDGIKTTAGATDNFIASYDATGAVRWGRTFGGSSSEGSLPLVAIDSADGGCYVASTTPTGFTIDALALAAGRGGQDIFVVAFDRDGKVRWVRSAGSDQDDGVSSLGLLPGGDLWIAGSFRSTLSVGSMKASSAGARDGYWLALKKSDGSPFALETLPSTSDLGVTRVAVDAARATAWFGAQYAGALEFRGKNYCCAEAFVAPLAISF